PPPRCSSSIAPRRRRPTAPLFPYTPLFRSPELIARLKENGLVVVPSIGAAKHAVKVASWGADAVIVQGGEGGGHTGQVATTLLRSEEHTSELQSRETPVCRLLPEKKQHTRC